MSNSPKGPLKVALSNVAILPRLGFNLFSLKVVNNKGHNLIGRACGEIPTLNDRLVFPLRGNTYQVSGYREKHSIQSPFAGNAVIAPGHQPSLSVDINIFHCSYGHVHESLLRSTVRSMGITLEGTLQPCAGCSQAKGLRRAIPPKTLTRTGKKLGRVFVDLGSQAHHGAGRKTLYYASTR